MPLPPTIRRIVALIQLGRPLFLAGGILLYLLGVVMALWAGATLNLTVLVLGQVGVTAIQWMTHYANDYFDLPGDRLNQTPTLWSGSSQVLPRGWLSPATALRMAVLLAAVAVLATGALALVLRPGLLTAAMFGLSLILSWSYSAPPLKLHSRGLGELTVAFLVTFMTPLIGYYLQAGRLALMPVLASLPLCSLQIGMMLGVAFPDVESDVAVGKGTLVVRLGRPGAAKLYKLLLVGAYMMLPLLILAGLPARVALAFCVGSPLAIWLGWRLYRRDYEVPRQWGRFVFAGIALLMCSGALELAAFVSLVWG